MKTHLNTLFVTLEGAYIHKDGQAVCVKHEGEKKLRVPLHNLDGIVCFGWDCTASASLMAACHEQKVSLSFHSPHGKFLASTQGGVSGNILLRRAQYRHSDDVNASLAIAKNCIAAKLTNSRNLLRRAVRDYGAEDPALQENWQRSANGLQARLEELKRASTLESVRGIEGEAAVLYFSQFDSLLRKEKTFFVFRTRQKRPPPDPVNALLSFCYALLAHDCRSACESVGLDPQCGFLHQDRPGRHSLALDLMEEFRPYLADRMVLSLVNRQQLTSKDFDLRENGVCEIKEKSRKKILMAWQERKKDTVLHPFLQEKMTIGLLPFVQARLLARYLRGDLDAYPPFIAS